MKYSFYLFAMIGIFASGCASYVPFTKDLANQYHIQEEQLAALQFYNSSDIILYKDVRNGESKIVSGKIKVIDGREVEEILIQAKTKGIKVNSSDGKSISISFEINDNYYLNFGENPKINNKFTLLASDWENGIGIVTYNDEKFKTPTQSGKVFLLVNLKKLQKMDKKERVAKGRKVH